MMDKKSVMVTVDPMEHLTCRVDPLDHNLPPAERPHLLVHLHYRYMYVSRGIISPLFRHPTLPPRNRAGIGRQARRPAIRKEADLPEPAGRH